MQVLERLPVDEPRERERRLRHAARQQTAHLVQEALLELRSDAPRDALGRLFVGNAQRNGRDAVVGQRRSRRREMLGQGTAGHDPNLERADQPLHIRNLDTLGGSGIDLCQPAMQAFRATPRRGALEPAPQRLVAPRPLEHAARQRAVIKPRPADENRQLPARGDGANHRRRLARVPGGRVLPVESQLTISPSNRSAMAMPSALLPVAVGPTMASRRGVSRTMRGRAPALLRPAAGWRFVEVERDDERRVLVRELEREGHGRVRELDGVERGLREGVDR